MAGRDTIAWGAWAGEGRFPGELRALRTRDAVPVGRVQHVTLRCAALCVRLASRGWFGPRSGSWAAKP